MAAGGEESDPCILESKQRKGTENEQESQWNESCYGIWLKDGKESGSKGEAVCLGINIVHITKRVLNSNVKPSSTRGVQIIIEEMAIGDADQMMKKDEEIGEDGMISYRAPKIKRPKKDDDAMNQPTLTESIVENFKQKSTNMNNRLVKYKNDPAAITEVWYELKDGAQKQYETGKRLLGHVKPSEKLLQMNTFVRQHFDDALNWFNEKSEK